MILREPCLPAGWYPGEKGKIEAFLAPFADRRKNADSRAAVAPHAGWYYSGACAAAAVSVLDAEAETVALIGGHLGAGIGALTAREDGVKTPLGNMMIDSELREEFTARFPCRPDVYPDNTVEVLLPMVRYFFPGAALLWLRFPADISSFEAGKALAESSRRVGRRVAVLASTDLTHYGENYGFSPEGGGKPALEWMKKKNDAAFINAVLEGSPALVLKRAEEDFSACSAGAVLGALGFIPPEVKGRLLDYRTSADAAGVISGKEKIPDSFVGYAAISFDVPSANERRNSVPIVREQE